MVIRSFVGRAVGAVVGLGILAVVVIPVLALVALVGIPLLIVLAVGGAVGAVALFSVGLPTLIVGLLAVMAVVALITLTMGALGFGVVVLKLVLFAMLLSWLFRKVFVRTRRAEPALVGAPVADIAAPRRDKYDIAAERELDEELGL